MSSKHEALIKPLTERERKLISRSVEICEYPANIENATYMYKPLCQIALPRSEKNDCFFERDCGAMRVKIFSHPEFGLPYGPIARLIIAYVCMHATRYKRSKINMQKSAAALMRELGFQVSGGRRGTYTTFKKQFVKLATTNFEFSFIQKNIEKCYETKIFDEKSCEKIIGGHWCKELELSDVFYASLVAHKNSVPMDSRALIALKDSALALDIYFFLVERLHRISAAAVKPTVLYWKKLRGQFGHEYAASSSGNKSFRDNFLHALEKVLLMYPAAKVELIDGGIVLRKSLPPIPKKIVVKRTEAEAL